MFVGARLYTGPMFVKYNTVLRACSGKVEFLVVQAKALCAGNKYSTTLHVINSALGVLSALSKCQSVYRGVSGGILPESFTTPSPVDWFRGGVEFGFMSTTHDREVAFEYAKGSGGIIFKMYMGMVDKGADLSPISQYPHECEICFPPLTALEVRGTHVDGSTTVVEVDARVCQTVFEHDFEQMSDIKTFQKHDADETGELDLHEFKRLARQLVPDVTDVHLESVFAAADVDNSGHIDFEEYRTSCVPMIKDAEVDVERFKEAEARQAREQELAQERHRVQEAIEARERVSRERALVKQARAFNGELKSRVKSEVLLLRHSVAELAAEMMVGCGVDRATPSNLSARKSKALAKAIEDIALSEEALGEHQTRLVSEHRSTRPRRARSSSPRPSARGHPPSRPPPWTPPKVAGASYATPRHVTASKHVTPRLELSDFDGTPRRVEALRTFE